MSEKNNTSATGQEDLVKEAVKEAQEAAAAAEGEQAEAETLAEEVADEAAEEVDEASEENGEEKKGFFSRKKDKEKEALKEQVAALDDQVKRQMAEFDNFRKRTEKEKEQMFSMGEKSVMEKLLPIVDNFERGFATVQEEDENDAFVLGMKKIYEQLIKQLTDLGVTPIEAVGQDFDPNFHNAVMQVDSDELETGKVAQELQKGYMYHDTVLRHSMVSVVK